METEMVMLKASEGEKKKKKKTQGKKKIEIKKIERLSSRLVAFSKRRLGLFKKASELCVLCGAEIAIIVQSLGKHFYSFGHNSTDAVIDRYLGGGVDDHERDVVAAPAELHLYRYVLKELELEMKRREVAEEGGGGGDVFWWNQGVEEMELDEMEQFAMALDELSKNADRRAKDLMGSFLSLPLAVASASASASLQNQNRIAPN